MISSKLSIAYDSIRSRDKAIEDLEGQIGALESDKYEALYFYEKAMKGREEWQGKAFAAEAEVAALRAQVAELEAADQWRPISEPPGAAGWYLGWNGRRIQIIQYLPEYEGSEIDWPWWDWYDDEVEITHWATLLAPPTEAPALEAER